MQVFALRICVVTCNSQQSVYTLFVKKIADTHSKRICDLMQSLDCDIPPPVNPVVYCLTTKANLPRQPFITPVFFFITRRRFSCDSKFLFCFIIVVLLLIKNVPDLS